MNSTLIFIAITFLLILVFLAIDYYVHKRWVEKMVDRINQIFDGIKTFFFVTLVDRFSSALEEQEDPEEDSDDTPDV
jgi:hypothetical protein